MAKKFDAEHGIVKGDDVKGCSCGNDCNCSDIGWSSRVRVSGVDRNLKRFVGLCDLLDECIGDLTRSMDEVGESHKFYAFRQELKRVRGESVVSAYDRGCFDWKI